MISTDLIAKCQKGDTNSQKSLFELTKAKMFGICLRFMDNKQDAEDILQEGYIKVFKEISKFRFEGNVEGWMRRIFVTTCLQALQTNKKIIKSTFEFPEISDDAIVEIDENESMGIKLIQLMHLMPVGFRTVLNLFVIEGKSHIEIAKLLGISEGTSKSQLNRAKTYMRKLVETSFNVK